MIKSSYIIGNDVEIKTPAPDGSESISSERGSRSFGATEMTSDFDATEYRSIDHSDENKMNKSDEDGLIDLLITLSDSMDESNEEKLANFSDFLIKKFSQAVAQDPTDLFNILIVKIRNSDIPNTNDIIKKITKIYSRSILTEITRQKNFDLAKKSAYKKALHRANQYLSEG